MLCKKRKGEVDFNVLMQWIQTPGDRMASVLVGVDINKKADMV